MMKRIWFNPVIGYSGLIDGSKYYVRLYQFEFIPMFMQWDLSVNQFKDIASSTAYDFTVVNRVSLFP